MGASITGFIAFEAPAGTRFWWQLGAAPLIGIAAALGAITGDSAAIAIPSMAVVAGVAALSVAVSRRLTIAALNVVIAFLIAQGLSLEIHDTAQILVLGAVGALAQAALSLIVALIQGSFERPHAIEGAKDALAKIRSSLRLSSPSVRHAIRSGGALGLAVAAYHVVHLGRHGYWIPLTVVFVLKPGRVETDERVEMRIGGTILGLAFATGLAVLVGENAIANTVIITITAAFAYAMLLIEYALFTFAITTYIVTMSHAVGESAIDAVDERAVGTAIGVAIALLAFAVWRDRPAPSTAEPIA